MAYALILSSDKTQSPGNGSYSLLHSIILWFRGFVPSQVRVEYRKIYENLVFYTITMPHPAEYFTKNKIGKRRTLKKFRRAIMLNNIEHFLLENPLREYLNGEWSMGNNSCLDESIRTKAYLLFYKEPFRDFILQDMTIALSGVQKAYLNYKLMSVLSNFKLVNVIGPDNQLQDFWDNFMDETGVPVCVTEDFDVLARSDIWISFEQTVARNEFDGVKIEFATKNILCKKIKKQYNMKYMFQKKLMKKLGRGLLQRFEHHILSEFLLNIIIQGHDLTLPEAEKLLGLNISVINVS